MGGNLESKLGGLNTRTGLCEYAETSRPRRATIVNAL